MLVCISLLRTGDNMTRWEGLEEAVVVADAGSFVGGARILKVSTSHISRAVARLEERIGTQIFSRTTRRVSLTAAGEAFINQVRHIIEDRENLLTSIGGDSEVSGELRISCSTGLGESFIAPIASSFARAHPSLTVWLDFSNRPVDIIAEGFDLAIRGGHVSDSRLVGYEIAVRPYETCAAPSYLSNRAKLETPSDLYQHECLLGVVDPWHFMENGTPRVIHPRGRWRCNSGKALLDAALGGLGICHLPRDHVSEGMRTGKLVPLLTQWRRAPEPVLAVYPQRRHRAPKVQQFVAALEQALPSALRAA